MLMVHMMHDLLRKLAEERRLFHSEADFQYSLAWKIHTSIPSAAIRLELPIRGEAHTHLDILVRCQNGSFPIQLKYKTSKMEVEVNGETFSLQNQSAQDIGRYDFLKDVVRLERFVKSEDRSVGYAIFLSNDALYWKEPKQGITSEQFSIHHGRQINSGMNWANHAGPGSVKGREKPIEFHGSYTCSWRDYSLVSGRQFRYLLLAIERANVSGLP